MKTNVVMTRKMGNFDIFQRTKDGMFNATELLKQWNVSNNEKKEVTKFFELERTKEFIKILIEEENLNTQELAYLKSRGKHNGGTWMHPYLFVKFAMWINPKFEYHVVKFVSDQLLKERNNAGDGYIQLSASGTTLNGYDYREVAIALQWIVFGNKGKELRQSATQDQLKELNDLQTKLSFAIDMGYITSYQQLISELRKLYSNKNLKF